MTRLRKTRGWPCLALTVFALLAAPAFSASGTVHIGWDRVEHPWYDGQDQLYEYEVCQFTLSEVPTGLCVRTEGRVSAGPVLEAYFTGLPCERFHWRVRAWSKCAESWDGCGTEEGDAVSAEARHSVEWSSEDLSALPSGCTPEPPVGNPGGPAPTVDSARRMDGDT